MINFLLIQVELSMKISFFNIGIHVSYLNISRDCAPLNMRVYISGLYREICIFLQYFFVSKMKADMQIFHTN